MEIRKTALRLTHCAPCEADEDQVFESHGCKAVEEMVAGRAERMIPKELQPATSFASPSIARRKASCQAVLAKAVYGALRRSEASCDQEAGKHRGQSLSHSET